MSLLQAVTRRKSKRFWVVVAIAVSFCCIFVYRVIAHRHYGTVVDAETGQLLKGVTVVVEVDYLPFAPLCYLHQYFLHGTARTVTDTEGTYMLDLDYVVPLHCRIYRTKFSFSKPGYSTITCDSDSKQTKLHRNPHYLNSLPLQDRRSQK